MRRVRWYGLCEEVCHIGAGQNNSSGFWVLAEDWLGSSCDKRMNQHSSDVCNFIPKGRHEQFLPFSCTMRSLLFSLAGTHHTGILDLLCVWQYSSPKYGTELPLPKLFDYHESYNLQQHPPSSVAFHAPTVFFCTWYSVCWDRSLVSGGEVSSEWTLCCFHPSVPFAFLNLFLLYCIRTFWVQLLWFIQRGFCFFLEVLHEALLVALTMMSFWFLMNKSVAVTQGLTWREKICSIYNSEARMYHMLPLNTARKNLKFL